MSLVEGRQGLHYAVMAAAAVAVTAGRCLHNPTAVTLAPVQLALLALTVALGTSRAPYQTPAYARLGRMLAKVTMAFAASPLFNAKNWARMEQRTLGPAIERFGVDPFAPLTAVQIAGVTSVLGYLAFVEVALLFLAPPTAPADEPGTRPEEATPKGGSMRKAVLRLENAHNMGLAALSAGMLVGIVRSCFVSGKVESLHALLCQPFQEDTIFLWTAHLFFWSKFWEWGDTALLVAKGKSVTWLHYTHHASTAVLTMLNMSPIYNAMWSIVCATNSFVHAWMYGYYWKPSLLRPLRRAITRIQILQHAGVLASALYVLRDLLRSRQGDDKAVEAGCANSPVPIAAGLGLYLMYLLFFLAFYIQTYVKKQRRGRPGGVAAATAKKAD
eukprot:TRINITY_DN2791_c0_g1_i2.p1 TRINITY_DN2791_c0_g1~~TRINITY_DN2791_c0_g1_i2.p1  ORF type:complete len:386 (+),score=81.57 TRINITY_DN2791_c0_g1_i2:122-1279(+)